MQEHPVDSSASKNSNRARLRFASSGYRSIRDVIGSTMILCVPSSAATRLIVRTNDPSVSSGRVRPTGFSGSMGGWFILWPGRFSCVASINVSLPAFSNESRFHPNEERLTLMRSGFSSRATYRPGSSALAPPTRNCMAKVVFPEPGLPTTSIVLAFGRPPLRTSSSPLMPVVTLSNSFAPRAALERYLGPYYLVAYHPEISVPNQL